MRARAPLSIVLIAVIVSLGAYSLIQGPQGAGVSSTSAVARSAAASSAATPTTSANAASTPIAGDWLTYHHDGNRTGLDSNDAVANAPGLAWSSPRLDGAVYAEPLVYAGQVYVATENDSVFSLRVSDGQISWRTHLGDPVPGSDLPCGDIDPSGITGTPVIDPSTNTLYAVAFLRGEGHILFALDTSTGTVKWKHGADAPASDPSVQQQRGALALAANLVVVPYGGLEGDCGPYHGYVVGFPASGTGELMSYQVPSGTGAGIWAPSGAAVSPGGEVFVATGNSESTGSFDYGESVIALSSDLKPVGYFAPSNWAELNAGDVDLGSVGPALLSNNTVFQIGKGGVGFLLRDTELSGTGSRSFSADVCGGAYGGTAYDPPFLYVPCTGGLVALRVNASVPSFDVAWRGPGFHAGPPIVAGGAVWTLDLDSGDLYALNAETGSMVFRMHLAAVVHFATPSAAEGHVFVATGDNLVALSIST